MRRTDFDQAVRFGWIARVGSVAINCKRKVGVTTFSVHSTEEGALLPVIPPSVARLELRTHMAGRRTPPAALTPRPQGEARLLQSGAQQGEHR
ncbi:hypothetical protein ACFCWY_35340 [Streptomyces sp. NPDC056362]|uniref:hypothetical protein n=1 Tax=unclassified Streptomyces TaxID=2593676 RepID=UPI0035DA4782